MDREFKYLFDRAHTSGCDKRAVIAGTYVISADDTVPTFVTSANYCVHAGDSCPRLELPPGAGYELCQAQHAEQNLVKHLRDNKLTPATHTLWVAGHYYACEPCAKAAKDFGFLEIRVRELPDTYVEIYDGPEQDVPGCAGR